MNEKSVGPDNLPPTIWVLAGPTASGKTGVALELADLLQVAMPQEALLPLQVSTPPEATPPVDPPPAGVEIISADARQIFRGMRIGTAQPTAAECARVRHHLVDCVDPLTLYTAADFGREGRTILADLAARRVAPLVVGGSGLYLRALIEGLFEGPAQDPELRARLTRRAETEGDDALHADLARVDPEAAARLHPHDRVRVIRALEVAELTGTPLSEHHRRQRRTDSVAARTLYVVLDREPEELEARIVARTAAMFAGGILEEARALLERGLGPEHPAYRTVGFQQAFGVLRGEMDVAAAIEATRITTRQYARRQQIWFKAEKRAIRVRAAVGEGPAESARRIRAALDEALDRRAPLD